MNQPTLHQTRSAASAKPKLLVIELWNMGDLVIATPFLRAASRKYELSLLAKPLALELQPRLWPDIKIFAFTAPWTAFKMTHKYGLWRWPVQKFLRLRRELLAEKFECGVSGRWDARDHFLLQMSGARERLGFPRIKSEMFLTRQLPRPDPLAHHYEHWRVAGQSLGLDLPPREDLVAPKRELKDQILIHSGARLPARVWPLNNYQALARRLRKEGYRVQIACDPDQIQAWRESGESALACPRTVPELLGVLDQSGVFIGNCSGPGHLAAITGVPTFTIFGPSLLEWWAPLHPAAEWIEGKACPYKPCSDYCQMATPECLWNVGVDVVWPRVETFARRHLSAAVIR